MSNLAKAFVIGAMTAEIAQVEKETWRGLPDRVCNSTTERKMRDSHERASFEQAELCRQTYLATSRDRLRRYQETGEIVASSVPPQLAL